jgi:hypothetical protein
VTEPPESAGDALPVGSTPLGDETDQAPAWLGELLRSLPDDDPPIPHDVAARLDAVLATLAAGRAAGGLPGALRTGGTAAAGDGDGGATVVPIESAAGPRRTNNQRKRSPLGWVGGLAAAALVVVGGTAIVHNMGANSTVGPSTAGGLVLPPGTASVTPKYVASGTGYTQKALPDQVRVLLTRAGISEKDQTTSTQATTTAPTVASVAPTPDSVDGADLSPASAKPSRDCLTDLSGSANSLPLVVDEATYDGHSVYVVIFATTGSTATVDVWVVKPSCNGTDSALITFVHAAR